MHHAAIGPIAFHVPERVESNDDLAAEHPNWNMELIREKTGIGARHIAAEGELPSDLAVKAAEKLFGDYDVDRSSVDFLLFCTQTPDYPLPTTACLIQDRLGLPTSIGALDFNLGCSGFVYGLAMAQGLIATGAANRILLITAETYSKYIDPADRSLRTVFGDGAAAALVERSAVPSLGNFVFGTDGANANALMVTRSGARQGDGALKPRARHRWPSDLYMDGPGLVDITLDSVPALVDRVLADAGLSRDDVELFLVHQATHLMLEKIRTWMKLDVESLPIDLARYGNTVSSTLPILMHDLRAQGRLTPGKRSMLIGFGVGFSWAGCMWTETWQQPQVIPFPAASKPATEAPPRSSTDGDSRGSELERKVGQ